jgi:hypothetical protein
MLISFELQTLQSGTWKIDSMYDDKLLAIDTAKRLVSTRRATAVRVVEESFSDDNDVRSRVVFRQSVVDGHNEKAIERKTEVHREARAARDVRQAERQRRRAPADPAGSAVDRVTWLIVKLIGIGTGGIVTIFILGRMLLAG